MFISNVIQLKVLDDDFDEKGFTIKEMKEMFNSSFEFSKTFTGNPPPMMKVLVNSDTK